MACDLERLLIIHNFGLADHAESTSEMGIQTGVEVEIEKRLLRRGPMFAHRNLLSR